MSEAAQERVKLAYEAYVRMVLQAMVNYVDGDERVDRMWIYTNMMFETIETGPFFRFDGQFLTAAGLAEADDSREYDPFELAESFDDDIELALVAACREAGAVPERIITTYAPASGSLESQWDYEGVLDGPDDTSGFARDRWIESLGGSPIYRR